MSDNKTSETSSVPRGAKIYKGRPSRISGLRGKRRGRVAAGNVAAAGAPLRRLALSRKGPASRHDLDSRQSMSGLARSGLASKHVWTRYRERVPLQGQAVTHVWTPRITPRQSRGQSPETEEEGWKCRRRVRPEQVRPREMKKLN